MKIIDVKDVLVSKKTNTFPELVKMLVVGISGEVDNKEVILNNFMLPLFPPNKEQYVEYENITNDTFVKWAEEALVYRQEIINRALQLKADTNN